MSRYLGNTPFRDLLTHSIASDTTIQNVADTLDLVFNKSVLAIPDVLLFARLAHDSGFINPVPMLSAMERVTELAGGLKELPSEILDLLAWQLHVDGYDTLGSLETKRKMIQMSLMLHRRKGTKWSILNALLTCRNELPTDITEWFQYNGRPYFFRVHFDVSEHEWVELDARNAFRLIFEYKNVRSWLDYIETKVTRPIKKYCGVGVFSRTRSRDHLYFESPPPTPVPIHYGLYIDGHTDMRSHIYFSPPPPVKQNIYSGVAIKGKTHLQTVFYFEPPPPVSAKVNYGIAIKGFTQTKISTFIRTA